MSNWTRLYIPLVVLLISSLPGHSIAQTQAPPEHSLQPAAEESARPSQHPATPPSEPAATSGPASPSPVHRPAGRAHTERGESKGWLDMFPEGDRLVAILTAFLVFSTLLLWWATRNLVRSAERTAELQLRAYLQVTKALVGWSGGPVVKVEVRNSGQTPAYGVALRVSVGLDPIVPIESLSARANVGGGESFSIEIPYAGAALSDEDIDCIEQGTKAWYVFGEISYRDIFRKERFTGLRYMLAGSFPSDGDPPAHMQVCGEGNETSESLEGAAAERGWRFANAGRHLFPPLHKRSSQSR